LLKFQVFYIYGEKVIFILKLKFNFKTTYTHSYFSI
jgi:hypothetical protein